MNGSDTCVKCSRRRKIHARRLCRNCYVKIKNMNLLDRYPRVTLNSCDVYEEYVTHVLNGKLSTAQLAVKLEATVKAIHRSVSRERERRGISTVRTTRS